MRWLLCRPSVDPTKNRSAETPPPPVFLLESADGNHVLRIYCSSVGLFHYSEATLESGDEYVGPYFAPTHYSGLYQTAVEAEADARRTLPWLRDDNSK